MWVNLYKLYKMMSNLQGKKQEKMKIQDNNDM